MELVDMSDSKSDSRERVGVQIPLPLPESSEKGPLKGLFLFLATLALVASVSPLACGKFRDFVALDLCALAQGNIICEGKDRNERNNSWFAN